MRYGDTVILKHDIYSKIGGKVNVKVRLNDNHVWYGIDKIRGKVFRHSQFIKIKGGL